MGYTSVPNFKRYRFDSVDSTTWISGNMSGKIFKFNNIDGSMKEIFAPNGKKLKSRAAALNNFVEWLKLCKYAKNHY